MIAIKDLKKYFGETCACDIPSFTINDGDSQIDSTVFSCTKRVNTSVYSVVGK